MLVKQKKDPRTWVYFLLPGLVVFLFVCFFSVSLQRLSYPYEIEWIEGGVLHQVTRVLDGLPLYTQPSMDFIPALYTPFYYYISAFFTGILGWGFFPLRLVSFCASIGVMCSIGWVVYEYSRNRLFAFVGAGFIVAMYWFTDFWFDVARVDSLWTFFLSVPLACLLVYRIRPNLQLLV
ncbi:MAG: hypothetical protein KDI30_07610, partial [Pseudomonadales bacterium]|nr:hypothetical protein [Pseudomonadales bacterium]